MELRDVEVFLILTEELHFRRTAERLYLSTGRVSQTVRALELEVGAPLFARNSRSVQLTALGRQFKEEAGHGLAQLRGALRRAQASAHGVDGILRVGYLACVGGPVVAALVSAFEARYPSTRVVMKVLHASEGFAMLRDAKVDVMLAWSPGGSADAVTGDDRAAGPILGIDERAVLVATDHQLAAYEKISVEDIAIYEFVDFHLHTQPAFLNGWTPLRTPAGKPLRRARDLDELSDPEQSPASLLDLLSVVAREHCAHLSIRSLLTYQPYPGLVLVPMTGLPPCVLVPVWQSEFETAAIRAFVDVMTELAGRGERESEARLTRPPREIAPTTSIGSVAS